ncbi:MAG: S-layer homology domain-containing protein [Candidatus Gracilibacteria bacterium]
MESQIQLKTILFYIAVGILALSFIGLAVYINNSLVARPDTGNSAIQAVFLDVPTDAPYAKAVFELKKQGILQGYPDNTFRPEKIASRVEALKMLLESSALERSDVIPSYERYMENEKVGDFIVFNDIPKDSWFAPYILKASRLNMISGNPDGAFVATKPVNYSEFLKMMLLLERDSISEDEGKTSPFPGVDPNQWYTPYFARAKALKLLPIDGETEMNPSEELSRGKIAMLLYTARVLRTKSSENMNGGKNMQELDRMRTYLEDPTASGSTL